MYADHHRAAILKPSVTSSVTKLPRPSPPVHAGQALASPVTPLLPEALNERRKHATNPAHSNHSHAKKTAGTGDVSLTVSVPAGVARTGIIVLHEVWGLSVPVTDLIVRLADCGYITAAPHLYHRIADPIVTDGNFRQARRYHDTLTMEGLTFDIESALAWIRCRGRKSR